MSVNEEVEAIATSILPDDPVASAAAVDDFASIASNNSPSAKSPKKGRGRGRGKKVTLSTASPTVIPIEPPPSAGPASAGPAAPPPTPMKKATAAEIRAASELMSHIARKDKEPEIARITRVIMRYARAFPSYRLEQYLPGPDDTVEQSLEKLKMCEDALSSSQGSGWKMILEGVATLCETGAGMFPEWGLKLSTPISIRQVLREAMSTNPEFEHDMKVLTAKYEEYFQTSIEVKCMLHFAQVIYATHHANSDPNVIQKLAAAQKIAEAQAKAAPPPTK